MNTESKVLSLLKEARIYWKQGLLQEALQQYMQVEKILHSRKMSRRKKALLEKVAGNIEMVDQELNAFLESKEIPEVSEKARELMRTMFSLDDPEVKGSSLMGEAIALAGFGQYEPAMKAFERLLDFNHLRMDAAKKILLYTLEFRGEAEAVSKVRQWESDNRFSMEDRNYLVKYLQELLKNSKTIENQALLEATEPESEVKDNDVMDINAVRLTLPGDQAADDKVRLDVTFQHGITLNIVVPRDKPEIARAFRTGDTIKDVRFLSPAANLSGSVYVLLSRVIDFGAQRGDTSINLKIITIN